MKTIHVTYTVRIPYVPDFLETTQGEKVSIGDIQESGLRKIGEEWTNELVKKAKLAAIALTKGG